MKKEPTPIFQNKIRHHGGGTGPWDKGGHLRVLKGEWKKGRGKKEAGGF